MTADRDSRRRLDARRRAAAGAVAAAVAAAAAAGAAESPLYAALTSPELRDPRGFILPSDQPDFGTATQFVNTLMKTGHHDPPRDGAVHRRRQDVSGQLATS